MFAPVKELNQNVRSVVETIDNIAYWLDPRNANKEIWKFAHETVNGGKLDEPFIISTMVGILFITFGAQWPKKLIFWGWITFWIMRGVIFR